MKTYTHKMKVVLKKSGQNLRYMGFQNGQCVWKAPRLCRYYFIGGVTHGQGISEQLFCEAAMNGEHPENGFYG